MIVCLGGLQSIGGDVYEAAAIDGANAFQRLRSITAPLVFRVTLPLLVNTFAYTMMNFELDQEQRHTEWAPSHLRAGRGLRHGRVGAILNER